VERQEGLRRAETNRRSGSQRLSSQEAVHAICEVIRRIPPGWVATYGQVASLAGLPRRARLVGSILQDIGRSTDLPWHRVVNASGAVSVSQSRNGGDAVQRQRLEEEGVVFDANDRFELERFRWHG
jgi:methylated-DNA-protein-cysteine methyltransferase related protein